MLSQYFPGFVKPFCGRVVGYDSVFCYYMVRYDDDDDNEEELSAITVSKPDE